MTETVFVCIIAGILLIGVVILFIRFFPRFPRAVSLWTMAAISFIFFLGTNQSKGTLIIFIMVATVAVMMTVADYFEYKPPKEPPS